MDVVLPDDDCRAGDDGGSGWDHTRVHALADAAWDYIGLSNKIRPSDRTSQWLWDPTPTLRRWKVCCSAQPSATRQASSVAPGRLEASSACTLGEAARRDERRM